jgi:hypothetical protein
VENGEKTGVYLVRFSHTVAVRPVIEVTSGRTHNDTVFYSYIVSMASAGLEEVLLPFTLPDGLLPVFRSSNLILTKQSLAVRSIHLH